MKFKLIVLFQIFQLYFSEKTIEKRLLLDKGNTGTETQLLEQELQNLRSRFVQIENEITSLQARNTQTENENMALKTRMSAIEKENSYLKTNMGTSVSTRVYNVWGQKTCPTVNGTHTLYSGILAGKHWNEKGSGVNTLCVPHDPDKADSGFPSSVHGNYFARLWGSEFQYNYKNVAINDDAPCAVCSVRGVSEILMFPSKISCPSGWLKQYRGFLIGAWAGEYASEYICMSDNPEYFEGTRSHNDDGRTLYPVVANCGSLPCPPYTNNQYIPCVVCST